MDNRYRLSNKQKGELLGMLHEGVPYRKIAKAFEISTSTVYHYARKNGLRYSTDSAANDSNITICPSCGQELTIPSGVEKLKFCYVCGKKIETRMEKFTNKLAGLIDNSKYMPEHIKVGYVDTIRELIDTVEKAFKNGEIKGWN